MRKLTLRLFIALLAFLAGVALTFMLSISQRPNKEALIPEQTVIESNRTAPEGWKKIDVDDRVSFYLLPNMKLTGLPGNVGIMGTFEGRTPDGKHLYLYYAYGERVPSDANPSSGQGREMLISGKRAKVDSWQYDSLELLSNPKRRPGMILFVPDVGDGKNTFEIYAVSFDLDAIKQIFDSVEIR